MAIGYEEMHDVAAEEENGLPKTMKRRCLVTGLDSASSDSIIASILASPSLPSGNISVNGTTLRLVRRSVQISESDSAVGTAWLDLHYERSEEPPGGSPSAVLRRGGRTGVRQVQTKRDRSGDLVKVSYNGTEQVATLNVFLPCAEPYIETIENTSNPDALALSWVGHTNSAAWRGQAAGQWLCTDASYEPATPGATNRWRFSWSFQLADDDKGWLPVVAFVDSQTGETPPDVTLTGENGLKTIPYYPTANFGAKFD